VHDTSPKIKSSTAADVKPRIAFVIPRGEVIRNFAHSGVLRTLNERASLSLITVQPKNSAALLASISDDVHLLKEIDERRIVKIQRDIIETAHGRWLWSRAAQFRWRVRDQEALTAKQKLVRFTKKAVSFPLSVRSGLRLLSRIERASSYMLRTTDEYIELMREMKPDLVFNGSHIHSRNAIQAMQAAQWLGIKTATFIFSWDNLTSQGRILLPYDHYLVWSHALKQQLLEMYTDIPPENVHVTGTPQFDFHFRTELYCSREEFCERAGIDPKRPIVLYTTGMANHMPGEPEVVEEIADMLAEAPFDPKPQLLVRVYPKDTTGRFEPLKEKRGDIRFLDVAWEKEWLTPGEADSADLVNTLRHCAVGINIASTISLELCMFDKPVINVGYNPRSLDERILDVGDYYEFDHYAPVAKSGAIEVARDRDQMSEMIRKALDDPGHRSAQRKALIEKMFGDLLDGKSAQRVSDVLMKIAS
jgi:hypothetical protein